MKWVDICWILTALLIGVVAGFAIFGGLQYYFPLTFWLSVATALFTSIGAIFGQLKVWFEVRKLMRDEGKAKEEIRKLQLEVGELERREQRARDDIRKLQFEVRKLEREENAAGYIVHPSYQNIVEFGKVSLTKEHYVAEDIVVDAGVVEAPEILEVPEMRRARATE